MPDRNLPTIPFKQIVQHPVTYALVVIVALLGFFVRGFTGASGQVSENCEEEKVQLRLDLTAERKRNDDLVQAILVKNGVINEIKKTTDSLVREKAGAESVRILNNNK